MKETARALALLLLTAGCGPSLRAGGLYVDQMPAPYFPAPTAPADRPPKVIFAVRPSYPPAYARKGIQGSVLVDFDVDEYGFVMNATVVNSPDPRLSDAAEAAVREWRFTPGIREGRPSVCHMRVPLVFSSSPADARSDPGAAADQARVRGEEALARRDYDAATTAFADALLLAPHSPEIVYDRGRASLARGGTSVALADFKEALRLDPDDPRFHLACGQVYDERRDYLQAIAACDEAIRLAPDSAAGYACRGEAESGLGRDDEALDDFGVALALDPRETQAQADRQRIAAQRAAWSPAQRAWAETRYATFETVWATVNDTYYDPTFGGVDWRAAREKYRVLLPRAADNARLRDLLHAMLAELKRTHFAILPREGAVFNPGERVRIGTAGAEVALIAGNPVITEVAPGSPAAAAGLKPGDRVTQVEAVVIASALDTLAKAGVPEARRGLYLVEYVQSSLERAVGSKVRLRVAGVDGVARETTVTCGPNHAAWSEPSGNFPSVPIRCEKQRGADGIARVSFDIFVLPVLKEIRPWIRSLPPGDGLIVDLRGNGGGLSLIAAGISGVLCAKEFSLGTVHTREGQSDLEVYPQGGAFAGPVAILIDGRSASTSEILAAGLQEAGRARVFGEKSAGAALPSLFKALPTGDLFQYAVGDVTTPRGTVLEGGGVVPDEVVRRTQADLAAGRDPVLAAATQWLDKKRVRP